MDMLEYYIFILCNFFENPLNLGGKISLVFDTHIWFGYWDISLNVNIN